MSTTVPTGFIPPFRRAAVLGAGTMGAQIAAHLANAGLEVDLMDMAPEEGDPNDIVASGFSKAVKMSPDPFFSDAAAERIRLGNFRDDLDRLADVDWVIEAIVERLDIKRDMMQRIEKAAGPDTIISTNTSGIPVGEIAEGRSESFRSRFLGTHFFNPPRYLELLEVIPSDQTDEAVVERIASFARIHLGKGVVVAKDSPYFIGNRIGVFGLLLAMREHSEGGFTIEEIDELTGTLVGHPKSATYRTADLVGLDVLQNVIENLYEKVPHDESREVFRLPDMMQQLIEAGRLGQKSGAGFYRKAGGDILSWNPAAEEYTKPESKDPGDIDDVREEKDLVRRLRMLLEAEGRSGGFFRRTTLGLMAYAARRIPEITESPIDVDRAIRWGFSWEMGPFEMWDAIGFERVYARMQDEGYELPAWVHAMHDSGDPSFYEGGGEVTRVWSPDGGGFVARPRPSDERTFDPDRQEPIWTNEEAALYRVGDDVALFEFRSKANTLGQRVLAGLRECIAKVESDRDLRGMVIANGGKNFSVGANLKEMGKALLTGQFDQIGESIDNFQRSI
ncbi:MAG: 3-hydroxyacyl-CoA dehydrogenase/enoyl-CoA hydratase family protein, partial [Rhodothermales bacterium]|nr:3-hydroxyacyl-CoA dehydrogenase/enoyl-CoA hydratase family protein [Rhodothermales bacterium]